MNLRHLLTKRRRAVLDDWLGRIAAGYPSGAKDFLQAGADRFANPVGSTMADAADLLLDALLQGAGHDELAIILDAPVRLRAVQRFSPAEAVGFIFDLKAAVRRVLRAEIRKGGVESELAEFEQRIDAAALVAFDAFVGCREHMFKLRAIETRNAAQRLLERAGLALPESPGEPQRPPSSKEGHRQGVTG